MDISKLAHKGKFSPKRMLKLMGSVIVLWLIKNKKRHGYALIKEMKDMGFKHFTPARAYPLLKFMHNQGWIGKRKEGRKIVYYITKRGRSILEASKKWFRTGKKNEFFKEMIGC